SFDEQDNNFDFKLLIIKILSHWKWFVLTILIALSIAYYLNLYKQNVYELDNYITVKEQTNPFFTSNMSLVFNWGGASDKINLITTTLKSRSHNEKVVNKLKSYIEYYKKGKYFPINIYKENPFFFEMDSAKYQAINVPLQIKILDSNQYQLIFKPENKIVQLYNYASKTQINKELQSITKTLNFGQKFDLPFLSGRIIRNKQIPFEPGTTYLLLLKNYNRVVADYESRINIKPKERGSSILVLKMTGNNKKQIADYLNMTTKILQKQILNDKNRFALNTIKFIDSTLQYIQEDLNLAAKDLKNFIKNKKIYNLDDPTTQLFEKLSNLDEQNNLLNLKKSYYHQLLDYLTNQKNYEDLPAPTVVGIDDPTIVEKINTITQLAIQRKNELTRFKPNAPVIKNLDQQIESLRQTIIETAKSALASLKRQLSLVKKQIQKAEVKISQLPEEKQELLGLKRKYELKQQIYNSLLQKRSEAGIVKASNVSDLKIIDKAKDVGQKPIAPNRQRNFLIAIALGLLLPGVVIVALFFLDNKIHDISDIEKNTKIPVIGQVYHWDKKGKLPVLNYSTSVVAESFRSIRSALRFMFYKPKESNTILITSNISGEGKTFVASNLAISQAVSNKKTVVLEFDLRKPKFIQYFKEANNKVLGLSHFLSGLADFNDIIVPTEIRNLDLILSGEIPPNPSELILSDNTKKLFSELSKRYDQIIIDSPPIGLVSDALELQKYANISIFIVRENYSLKSFVKDIEEKKDLIKNIGIIYNDFRINVYKKYGYGGYGYGYGYGEYFENNDKSQSGFFSNLIHKFFKKKA
ncbi:MAG TPA: polysaccharide biosynthesis tyrosine autokinase, partial [Flavobacteriia bacterium]|nr:polysaccharide biosynthesis tyrosine autokinase [Flavobacteriia bacterium]